MMFCFILLQFINPKKIQECFEDMSEYFLKKNPATKGFLEYFYRNWINEKTAFIPLHWW